MAFSRTALGSSSRPTKSCSISCSAGPHSDPAVPWSTSRMQAPQTVREPVAKKTPHATDTAAKSS